MSTRASAVVSLLLAATCFTPARAQTAPAQTAPAQEPSNPAVADSAVADIVVTAQRRDESLARTPVAVAVIGADTLAKAQIKTESDLQIAAPGLTVRTGITSNLISFALRGQSLDVFSNTRPGVLPYVNDVQISGTGTAGAIYDLQSVQVLKGIQGTLFGRSSTGGAVLFSTQKPLDTFGGYASASYGDFDTRRLEGAINVPLGDGIAARVSGFYQNRHGFQTNLYNGERVGDLERYGLRGSLSMKLGETVHNELVVDYFHAQGQNTAPAISGLFTFTGVGAPFVPVEFLYAGVLTPAARATGIATAQAFLAAAGPAAQALVPAYYDAYYADPRHPQGGIRQALADQLARGPYIVDLDGGYGFRARNVLITNTTEVEIGDSTKVRNIFGYGHFFNNTQGDTDGTPFGEQFLQQQPDTSIQYTEELQLLGKALDGRLDYVVGGYYSNEARHYSALNTFFDALLGGAPQVNAYNLSSTTLAAYTQGTYKLNDSGLSATAGIRYTQEKPKLNYPSTNTNYPQPVPAGVAFDQSAKYPYASYTLGIQDQITPETLLYAVTRGTQKAGGFNGSSAIIGFSEVGGSAYRAERTRDAEAGLKFQGRVATMPTRLNLAAYYIWTRNNQRSFYYLDQSGQPSSVSVNVPKARTYGFEADGTVQPTRWLRIGGSLNYTNARFVQGAVTIFGFTQIFDRVPDTPEWSGTVFADGTFPLTGELSLALHGDLYGQTKAFTGPRSANANGTTVPGYSLAAFRVGIENQKAGWSISANVKNAFDRVYYTGGFALGEIVQANTLNPGEPRYFSVEGRIKF